jgi:hypothetical protein
LPELFGRCALHNRADTLENLGAVATIAGDGLEATRAFEQGLLLLQQKGCTVCAARVRSRLRVAAGQM